MLTDFEISVLESVKRRNPNDTRRDLQDKIERKLVQYFGKEKVGRKPYLSQEKKESIAYMLTDIKS